MHSPLSFLPARCCARCRLATTCLALALVAFGSSGQGRNLTEDQVKAAFLYNFAAFVKWPEGQFASPSEPFRYCTRGAEGVSDILERLIAGERLDGRPMQLVRLRAGQDASGCHILYLGLGGGALVNPGTQRGVLTVGNREGFVKAGGMVALVRRRNRVHPVVNLDALDASPLRLSSKFLRLATLLRPGRGD